MSPRQEKPLTENSKSLAESLAAVFGGRPKVFSYWDEPETSCVHVLSCKDSYQKNVTSYATLGLSDYRLWEGFGVEFVAAFGGSFDGAPNIVSTAAFCVINSGWKPHPGAIFYDIVGMYYPTGPMQNLLLADPFLWRDMRTLELSGRKIAFLHLVAISEAEARFHESEGYDALAVKFEEAQIDVFNLGRPSVV